VPVAGAVTYNGEPLAGAVVVFLPVDELGTLCHGETDKAGKFRVSHTGWPGATPGSYKVGISYQVTGSGRLVTLSMHSSAVRPYEVMIAKEQIPQEYSELGRTKLRAEIPPTGAPSLNFDLEGPPLNPPSSTPAAEPSSAPTADTDGPEAEPYP
jgi:hypothetical protein